MRRTIRQVVVETWIIAWDNAPDEAGHPAGRPSLEVQFVRAPVPVPSASDNLPNSHADAPAGPEADAGGS